MASKQIYEKMLEQGYKLSKDELTIIIGRDFSSYRYALIDALVSTGRVSKRAGRGGGIEYRSAQGQSEILSDNALGKMRKTLSDYAEEEAEEAKERPKKVKEIGSDYYQKLQQYLLESGKYKAVEIVGSKRSGGKWENVDLVAINYSDILRFHVGVFPVLTAFEVKGEYPRIEHIAQAGNYLRFFHCSYLCFYAQQFSGKNIDDLITRLQEDKLWEAAEFYRIGLMVTYYPRDDSKKLRFQVLREAPQTDLDAVTAEDMISELAEENQRLLTQALKNQIAKLISD